MSALQKLVPAGLAAVIAMTGCQAGTAPVQPDIMETDTLERQLVSQVATHWEETDAYYTAVRSITPDFSTRIAEKERINSDVVGWLKVPGTTVDDVILHNPEGTSNAYYLDKDLYGNYSRNGSYCTDIRTKFGSGTRAELSRNITIYGHSWNDNANGELFAQLKKYRTASFAREHPYIFFSTGAENMVWEVFAVFDAHVDLPYISPNPSRSNLFDTLDIALQASLYNYDIAIAPDERILTLSTCVYSVEGHGSLPYPNKYRFVVMARLASPDEPLKTQAEFVVNRNPITPDEVQELANGGAIRQYTYGTELLSSGA